jgi:Tfp pilus assembly protein PilF
VRVPAPALLGLLLLAAAGSAPAAEVRPAGEWDSPLAVLLVGKDRLAGAVHVEEAGCRAAAAGKQGGVTFTRVESARDSTGSPRTDSGSRRARARALLRDGAAYLHEGAFERARERFLEAIDADARVPEAYNGVGVTFRMRNDLAEALAWYKKALAIDPDFGDAWYNMACVYALQGEQALALRYLQIAALNGYATAAGIDGDPDLDALRADPAYRALVQARM